MNYLVIGRPKTGRTEVLDSFDTAKEAKEAAQQYRIAYGPGWRIFVISK